MLWFYRFIIGFLDVEFKGEIAETVLNICAKNGISLWHIRRSKEKICAKITVRDFKMLPYFSKKSGVRTHIVKRYGFPFTVNRYKKRLGIPIGAALFFLILKIMSLFIWSVEVSGNERTATSDIVTAAGKIGIYEGIKKTLIDPPTAKQKLLLEVDGLAWASFNIEGSRLIINVNEANKNTDKTVLATNLKSKADGIITKISVTSGNCVVKVGDSVSTGDLLVSGIIERLNETEFVNSKGVITAKTEREITVKANYKRTVSRRTGKIKKHTVFEFFGIKIPLYLGKINKPYESKSATKQFVFLGGKLPIKTHTKTFMLTTENDIEIGKNELINELERLLAEVLKVEKISDFVVKNREYDEISGGISLKTLILAEENIALPEELLFNTGN